MPQPPDQSTLTVIVVMLVMLVLMLMVVIMGVVVVVVLTVVVVVVVRAVVVVGMAFIGTVVRAVRMRVWMRHAVIVSCRSGHRSYPVIEELSS
jgi:hypothetical protein